MSTPQQLFQEFLEAQRSAYGRSLPDKVGQIAAQWHLVASGSVGRASLAELEHLAHTLAGTAATLGFVAAGRAAKALELLVQRGGQVGADGADGAALNAEIERAIGLLQDSLPDAAAVPPDAATQTPANSPESPKAAR